MTMCEVYWTGNLDPIYQPRRRGVSNRPLDMTIYVAVVLDTANDLLPRGCYKIGCTSQDIERRFDQIWREYCVSLRLVARFAGSHLIEQSILEIFRDYRIDAGGRPYGEFLIRVGGGDFDAWIAGGAVHLAAFDVRPRLLQTRRSKYLPVGWLGAISPRALAPSDEAGRAS